MAWSWWGDPDHSRQRKPRLLYFSVAKGKILGISDNPVIDGFVVIFQDLHEFKSLNERCLWPTFFLKLFNGYVIIGSWTGKCKSIG